MGANNILMGTKLEAIAAKYGTDKLIHGYIPFYEKYLPENPKKILEIGCLHGASIRMWREYFPDAEIHCLDLFEHNEIPEIEGVKFWKGNQLDWKILELLRKENFDVIIEDGSHNSLDQIVTFYSLIGSCDIYFCEDLHCAREDFYRNGLPFNSTFLGMMWANKLPFDFELYNDKIAYIKKTHAL